MLSIYHHRTISKIILLGGEKKRYKCVEHANISARKGKIRFSFVICMKKLKDAQATSRSVYFWE